MIKVKCLLCGETFKIYKSYLRRGRGKFCSKKCFDIYQCNGDKPGYYAVHRWLRNVYGKASKCESKRCKRISDTFQWALIHNKAYCKSRNNFKQLCASCHAIYDRVDSAPPFSGKKHTDETKKKMRLAWVSRDKVYIINKSRDILGRFK